MNNLQWKLSDLGGISKNGYNVFSLFAGGGGSSLGYKLAGFDVIGMNEIDKRQAELYIKNLKPKYSFIEDIRIFKNRDDLPKELYELDILDASPPCSLFSGANLKADDKKGKEVKFREGQVKQVLDDLFFETIEVVDKLKPKVVIMENVKGLLFKKNKWYVDEIYKRMDEIGYNLTHKLINLVDTGVPQKRQRVFFIGVRKDLGSFNVDLSFNHKHITIGEIDSDLKGKPQTPFVLNWLKQYKDGDKSLGDIRKRVEGKTTGFQTYIIKDTDVCNTLRAGSNDFIRIDKPPHYVRFSDYELIQLSTFPLDYDFGKNRVIYVVGMSVPPFGIKAISERIKRDILDKLKNNYVM